MSSRPHVIITCDEDWAEHGLEHLDAVMPNEAKTLTSARLMADTHARVFGGPHTSFRMWTYDRSYTPPMRTGATKPVTTAQPATKARPTTKKEKCSAR